MHAGQVSSATPVFAKHPRRPSLEPDMFALGDEIMDFCICFKPTRRNQREAGCSVGSGQSWNSSISGSLIPFMARDMICAPSMLNVMPFPPNPNIA